MTVKLLTGSGISGLVDYVTKDKPTQAVPRPTTAGRVAHTESLGLHAVDPDIMIRCMQGLTADAAELKRRAGVSTRGRRLREPYGHLMLSESAGRQPTAEEWRTAARGALAAIGVSERHYGVLSVHHDTNHRHAHVVFSRIDPATGKAAKLTRSHNALSRWARDWEREHGGIVVQGRDPDRRSEPRQEVRDATGRRTVRTPEENRQWHELLKQQAAAGASKRTARAERTALNLAQTKARVERMEALIDDHTTTPPARLDNVPPLEPERHQGLARVTVPQHAAITQRLDNVPPLEPERHQDLARVTVPQHAAITQRLDNVSPLEPERHQGLARVTVPQHAAITQRLDNVPPLEPERRARGRVTCEPTVEAPMVEAPVVKAPAAPDPHYDNKPIPVQGADRPAGGVEIDAPSQGPDLGRSR